MIEWTFEEGAQKICYTKIMTKREDGKTALTLKLDTIRDLSQEITSVANSVDTSDPQAVKDALAVDEGIVRVVLSREDFEIMKDLGCFRDVDDHLAKTYLDSLKNGPQ